MYNICLYGIDLKRRDNIPSFSFKLVFLGAEQKMNILYRSVLPKVKCEWFNDVSDIRCTMIGDRKFWFFEFIGSEKTMRSFIKKLEEYKLVVGKELLLNSCDIQHNKVFHKCSEMVPINRIIVGSRFEDIKDIVKQFSINESVGNFLEEKGMYSKSKLSNHI